jgi:AcrR family transcriptional regulator
MPAATTSPTSTTSRRRRLDRTTVVEAARQLLDDEGLAALSMPRLGERLGVTAMALYRHVSDRADLESAVVELVLSDLAVEGEAGEEVGEDAAGESVDVIATWMHRVRACWLAHPWLGSLLGSSTSLNPSWVTALEHLAHALEWAGLPDDEVARELVRISRTTCGIVIQEIAAPLPQPGGVARSLRRYAPALRQYDNDALFDDLVAETVRRVERHSSPTPDEQ